MRDRSKNCNKLLVLLDFIKAYEIKTILTVISIVLLRFHEKNAWFGQSLI